MSRLRKPRCLERSHCTHEVTYLMSENESPVYDRICRAFRRITRPGMATQHAPRATSTHLEFSRHTARPASRTPRANRIARDSGRWLLRTELAVLKSEDEEDLAAGER